MGAEGSACQDGFEREPGGNVDCEEEQTQHVDFLIVFLWCCVLSHPYFWTAVESVGVKNLTIIVIYYGCHWRYDLE